MSSARQGRGGGGRAIDQSFFHFAQSPGSATKRIVMSILNGGWWWSFKLRPQRGGERTRRTNK